MQTAIPQANKKKNGAVHLVVVTTIACTTLLTLIGCEGETTSIQVTENLKQEAEVLSNLRIFFGHQSVGRDILRGISDISAATGKDIQIGSLEDGTDFSQANFLEAHIGENRHPDKKIQDFAQKVRAGIGTQADVALMKFCYVDTRGEQSPDYILSQYIMEMEKLEDEYPDTVFVYVTMPLSSPMRGWKNQIKRMLGRLRMVDSGHAENVVRHEFNADLRDRKGSTGRLFDLAAVESMAPNGEAHTVEVDGRAYQALYQAYTYDGGHLNELGRKVVAKALIDFLASLR